MIVLKRDEIVSKKGRIVIPMVSINELNVEYYDTLSEIILEFLLLEKED